MAEKKKMVCIVCGEEREEGTPVEEDVVLKSIRSVKQSLGIATNNILIVCEQCEEEYRKKREKFEKTFAQHVLFGILILLAIVVVPMLVGGVFQPGTILLGVLVAAFIIALSIVQYFPSITDGNRMGKKEIEKKVEEREKEEARRKEDEEMKKAEKKGEETEEKKEEEEKEEKETEEKKGKKKKSKKKSKPKKSRSKSSKRKKSGKKKSGKSSKKSKG